MVKLRTRYKIVFLYYENDGKKCFTDITPEFYKQSGAVDGDAFETYREIAKEIYNIIPKKCIIEDGSGVCIVTYQVKEKFIFKEKPPQKIPFVYHNKVSYILTTNKKGIKIAYKVNTKTGKKQQTNYKKARKNNNSQTTRIKKAKQIYIKKIISDKKAYKQRKEDAANYHRYKKKIVLKQYQMFQGCTSKDMVYKGR